MRDTYERIPRAAREEEAEQRPVDSSPLSLSTSADNLSPTSSNALGWTV